jgi:hypothetical protein
MLDIPYEDLYRKYRDLRGREFMALHERIEELCRVSPQFAMAYREYVTGAESAERVLVRLCLSLYDSLPDSEGVIEKFCGSLERMMGANRPGPPVTEQEGGPGQSGGRSVRSDPSTMDRADRL